MSAADTLQCLVPVPCRQPLRIRRACYPGDDTVYPESAKGRVVCECCCRAKRSSAWVIAYQCHHGFLATHALVSLRSVRVLPSERSYAHVMLQMLCGSCRLDVEEASERANRTRRVAVQCATRRALGRLPDELIALVLEFLDPPRVACCEDCLEPRRRVEVL